MNHDVDREKGGIYGLVDTTRTADKNSPRSCVLNARILWTFSAALNALGSTYFETADRAFAYLMDKFWDREDGGLFWMLDCHGDPVSTRKQIYGQAFGIYGLAEFHRATGSVTALERAMQLFQLIEKYGRDRICLKVLPNIASMRSPANRPINVSVVWSYVYAQTIGS